jgi:beta-mannosidase
MPHLTEGWILAVTPAGACGSPAEAAELTDWIPARVPGTADADLRLAGRSAHPLHDKDVWYRLVLRESGRRCLRFEGLATLAQVWLDHVPLLTSESMFQPHEVETQVSAGATLWLCFRALEPRLQARGPRARWRPAMIEAQGLRLVRHTLLGHMPGWRPRQDIVGPWRAIHLKAADLPAPRDLRLQADWDGAASLVVELALDAAGGEVTCAGATARLEPAGDGRLRAALRPDAEPWWPHTHGDQPLYAVHLRANGVEVEIGRVGFRRIEADRDGGFALRINGEPVFCRGACWVSPELGGERCDYEPALRLAREAGMNMVRVSGVGVYETRAFYDLCSELGLLVWQDFMFANFDYPVADPGFVDLVRAEAEAVLAGLQGAPSLAVLCGGSEVMQQAAMMGLPPLAWPLFLDILPEAAGRLRPDVPYVPNTPSGGALPFCADEGVTHYYGVGAYERPLTDARLAEVKFAAECLAFANVPQPRTLARHLPVPAVHDPRWKAAVPRDRGASWDFEDVRDHYLRELFDTEPYRLRREDPALYLDLSRMVSGDVMAAVFTEWRRARSPCAGGLVWTLRDQLPGAGWGLVDAADEPKPALYALRRVLQPVQVLITDEGVNGLAVHLINETAQPLSGEIRLSILDEQGAPSPDVRQPVHLAPRSGQELSAFALLGRFFDLSYAYRFGPRAHAAVRAQLIVDAAVASEAFHFLGPRCGLSGGEVEARLDGDDLVLTSSTLQRWVHIEDAAFRPADDGFPLAAGEPRRVRLVRRRDAAESARPEGDILAPGGRILGGYRAD